MILYMKHGPGSSVGIATGYGLDGLRIESRWGGEVFRNCPDRPWGPPSLLYNGYRVFPEGEERPRRDADPTPPSNAVGHKRVELYLYSPYGPYVLYRASVPVQGWPLPLLYMKRSSWCNPQSPIEVFSHTRLIVLWMFIIWQQVSTSSVSSRHCTRTWMCTENKFHEVRHFPLYIKNSLHCNVLSLRTVRPIYRTGVPLPSRCCIFYIFFNKYKYWVF